MIARRYDEALATFNKVERKDPNIAINHERLAHLYSHLGRFREAIAEESRARVLSGENIQQASAHEFELTQAFESHGKNGYWLKELEFMKEPHNPPEAYVTPVGLAIIYSELGDKTKVIESLEQAYAEHDLFLTELGVLPEFDFLRHEPRFQSLLRGTGLRK